MRMNRSALERRAGSIGARRTVKKEWQAAWLLKAITLMDLTTLNSATTPPGRVERLCAKARHPVRDDILRRARRRGTADPAGRGLRLPQLRRALRCARSTAAAFRLPRCRPASRTGSRRWRPGSQRSKLRSRPARSEIDIVIERQMVLTGDWQALYDQMKRIPQGLRRRPHQDHSRHRRARDARQRGQGVAGLHAGGRRLHQDLDRQGKGQRQPPDLAGDDPHDPLVPRGNRHHGRLQAGRRHRHGQGWRSTTWR